MLIESQSYNIIFGNTSAQFTKPTGEAIRKWCSEIPNDGLLRFRAVGNQDRIICTTPETLKSVMSDNSYDFEKPGGVRKFLVMILGNGLIIAEGNLHKFQRKHLLPAFQVQHIRELHPAFWDKSRAMVEAIEADVTERKLESDFAVSLIARFLFSDPLLISFRTSQEMRRGCFLLLNSGTGQRESL
jgi:cytochrome P450